MGRIVWRIVFVLSLSLNLAFVGSLVFSDSVAEGQSSSLILSEKQKQEVARIQQIVRQKNESIKRKLFACQRDLLTALNQDHVDKDKITKCIEDISTMQKQIQMNAVDQILQIRQHLDKSQCNCLMKELEAGMAKTGQPCDKDCCQEK